MSKPTDEQKAKVTFWIKQTFYYVGMPKHRVDPYYWKDRDGEWTPMSSMSLDHLNASSRMVSKDIDSFENSNTKDKYREIYEKYILKQAKEKLSELRETLAEKVKK